MSAFEDLGYLARDTSTEEGFSFNDTTAIRESMKERRVKELDRYVKDHAGELMNNFPVVALVDYENRKVPVYDNHGRLFIQDGMFYYLVRHDTDLLSCVVDDRPIVNIESFFTHIEIQPESAGPFMLNGVIYDGYRYQDTYFVDIQGVLYPAFHNHTDGFGINLKISTTTLEGLVDAMVRLEDSLDGDITWSEFPKQTKQGQIDISKMKKGTIFSDPSTKELYIVLNGYAAVIRSEIVHPEKKNLLGQDEYLISAIASEREKVFYIVTVTEDGYSSTPISENEALELQSPLVKKKTVTRRKRIDLSRIP